MHSSLTATESLSILTNCCKEKQTQSLYKTIIIEASVMTTQSLNSDLSINYSYKGADILYSHDKKWISIYVNGI